ncbi:hypothetical protein DSO57_1010149 [Entomophthora muscae]|uniref:Uncharacterized protein n=1 Tax=Entomophthora muscae TaxID=34485 RepID=A0ACC2THW2_9FUNG|nr:hypothetical protein DSO57_1010149 [Entomophthora muscae]
MYTSMYYILTYFAGSFGRYNVHTKVFRWLMTVYPIITALTGFQFANLLPYILQVVPTEVTVTVENQMKGITRPRKTRNQQRTTAKPLKEIDDLNAVIDKKWVKAGVAQIALENLDLPYFYPNNYDKKITHYTLFGDGSA